MSSKPVKPVQKLPKRAIEQVHLGQSFAEYDTYLRRSDVYVHTPALAAATTFDNPHCFFVGRRGTGKTTITKYVESKMTDVSVLRPEIFSPTDEYFTVDALRGGNQRPFRSLVSAFRRALQDHVLGIWREDTANRFSNMDRSLVEELETVDGLDFDLALLLHIESVMKPLFEKDERAWVSEVKIPKSMAMSMVSAGVGGKKRYTVLIDAIDESWDGSELAVIYLAALMHACVEINSHLHGVRVLMFLRENIFERVRVVDSEFSRLETCVVGLDWSTEQLLEMVERRLNAPLTTKFALGGTTWDLFFEGAESRKMVFDFCQKRPRDVLTYCGLALDNAQSRKHDRIMIEDLQDASRRFSTSRLSDLGDEYQENYPQISLLLGRFYGLGRRWTLVGVDALIRRLLEDPEITTACAKWIYRHTQPEQLSRLLYDIGFFGFRTPRRDGTHQTVFRSLGPQDTTPPPITNSTDMVVHASYWEALDLQDVLVQDFSITEEFRSVGLVTHLPNSLDLETYNATLADLLQRLKDLPTGLATATQFEDIVGQVVKLCFFRVLANVEPQVRNIDGTVRRDWVASNRAEGGFWEVIRHRYSATQVLFECKNYEDLSSGDFQQLAYYLNDLGGKFAFLVFRGDVTKHNYEHIKRVSINNGALIFPLNDKDLQVFIRQSINGKLKESHLLDKFDKIQRTIS